MEEAFRNAAAKLDFEKILSEIRRYTLSEPGAEEVSSMRTLTDPNEICRELALVSEMKQALESDGEFPLAGIHAIDRVLRKATLPGVVLEASDLIRVSQTLAAARLARSFISRREKLLPLMANLSASLHNHKLVEYNINGAVDQGGSVRSDASKELSSLRRSIVARYDNLRKKLSEILSRVSEDGFAQEDIITTREGRMVIPVKSEHKNRVPGFIHSSSSSGATVFVEPTQTLELNNEITDLQFRERREIQRILAELTAQVGEIAPEVQEDLRVLAKLDSLYARGKYSIQILGAAPTVTASGELRLRVARHPLLVSSHGYDATVPMDIALGGAYQTLVISGPNAGGKSVMLKSVGLLTLMAQSGIHIPANPDSVVRVFTQMFADIGDDQSIENDLSTFSSRLSTLKTITELADERSLVLLDEIGTGTDPAEGSAFAAAILENLTVRKAVTIATTHHGTLKAFAHQTEGIQNGAMEFDLESLTPTYRFRAGVPGSSYALEMSRRLMIDPAIIERSKEILGTGESRLEGLLMELESAVQNAARTASWNEEKKRALERMVEQYDHKLRTVSSDLKEKKQMAILEARQIVEGAHALVERTIREIRESAAEPERTKAVRAALNQMEKSLQTESATSPNETSYPIQHEVGDRVLLRSGSSSGIIDSIDSARNIAVVISGDLRLHVKLHELVRAGEPAQQPSDFHSKAAEVAGPPERDVDVRGMSGDEAVQEVDRVLDRAVLSGLHRVDIIHGKGTGALRKRIGEFLRNDERVLSFRAGEWNEGGIGATIVELSED